MCWGRRLSDINIIKYIAVDTQLHLAPYNTHTTHAQIMNSFMKYITQC